MRPPYFLAVLALSLFCSPGGKLAPFVSCMNALEMLYGFVPLRGPWTTETIVSILREHLSYIQSERYDEFMRPTMKPNFQALIDERVLAQSKQDALLVNLL